MKYLSCAETEINKKKNTGRKRKDEDIYEDAFDEEDGFVKGKGVSVHKEGKEAEMLLYFLQHGVLPWYATLQSKAQLQQLFTLLIANHDFKQEVNAFIMTDETAFERLVCHIKEDDIFSLIENMGGRVAEFKRFKKSWHRIFALLNLSPSKQKKLFFKGIFFLYIS